MRNICNLQYVSNVPEWCWQKCHLRHFIISTRNIWMLQYVSHVPEWFHWYGKRLTLLKASLAYLWQLHENSAPSHTRLSLDPMDRPLIRPHAVIVVVLLCFCSATVIRLNPNPEKENVSFWKPDQAWRKLRIRKKSMSCLHALMKFCSPVQNVCETITLQDVAYPKRPWWIGTSFGWILAYRKFGNIRINLDESRMISAPPRNAEN